MRSRREFLKTAAVAPLSGAAAFGILAPVVAGASMTARVGSGGRMTYLNEPLEYWIARWRSPPGEGGGWQRIETGRGLASFGEEAIPVIIEGLGDERNIWALAEALARLPPTVFYELSKALASESACVRTNAAYCLSYFPHAGQTPTAAMLAALHDSDARVRLHISVALEASGVDPAELAPPLIEILVHDDAGVRCDAAELLANMRGKLPVVQAALERRLADPSVTVRVTALAGLANEQPHRADLARGLVQVIQSTSDAGDMQQAVIALVEMGQTGEHELLELARHGDLRIACAAQASIKMRGERAINFERAMGRELVPRLTPNLSHCNLAIRRDALGELSRLDAIDVSPLRQLLADPHEIIRRDAARMILNSKADDETAVQILVASLPLLGRCQILDVVGTLNGRGIPYAIVAPYLEHVLDTAYDSYPRIQSLELMRDFGAPTEKVMAFATELLDEEHVIPMAMQFLASLGGPGLARVHELLRSPDEDVRRAAVSALFDEQPNAPATLAAVVGRLGDGRAIVRAVAVEALGRICALRKGTPLPDCVAAIYQAVDDSDIHVREAAAWALGPLAARNADAISALNKALNDPSHAVRFNAEVAFDVAGLLKRGQTWSYAVRYEAETALAESHD